MPSNKKPGAGSELGVAAGIAAIAAAAAEMVRYGTETTGQRVVALSGGVFMNRILTGLLAPRLEDLGLTVLLHRDTPPNDGCIAIGQAIVAGSANAEFGTRSAEYGIPPSP